MTGDNSLLSAIFNVLASGRKKAISYKGKEALVSQLYPYFLEDGLSSATALYDLSLIPIGKVIEIEEVLLSQTSLYAFEVRPLITEYSAEPESLQTNTALYELVLTSVVKPITINAETVAAQTVLYYFGVNPLGVLYSEPSETLAASTALYELYIGST